MLSRLIRVDWFGELCHTAYVPFSVVLFAALCTHVLNWDTASGSKLDPQVPPLG